MCSYPWYLPDYSKQPSEERDAFSHLQGSTSSPSSICTCYPSCPEILFSPISSSDQHLIHLSNVMQVLTVLREPEGRHVEQPLRQWNLLLHCLGMNGNAAFASYVTLVPLFNFSVPQVSQLNNGNILEYMLILICTQMCYF